MNRSAKETVRYHIASAVRIGIKSGLTALEIRELIESVLANYNL